MFKIRPTLIAGNYNMSCNTMLSNTTRPIYLAYLCRGDKKNYNYYPVLVENLVLTKYVFVCF